MRPCCQNSQYDNRLPESWRPKGAKEIENRRPSARRRHSPPGHPASRLGSDILMAAKRTGRKAKDREAAHRKANPQGQL